jgi:integrase/recombinase XerD
MVSRTNQLDASRFHSLSNQGDTFSPNRLSQMVREYVDGAQLGKSGACHLFRHTMATLMLENGADIRFIQAMLGHAELSTTQIYTQVSIRKLKEIHSLTHPARLEKPITSTPATSPDAAAAADAQAREQLQNTLDAEADEEVE